MLHGAGGTLVTVRYKNRYGRQRSYSTRYEGVIPWVERRHTESESERAREIIEGMTAEIEGGKLYRGKVVTIKEFGAFVEVLPGKDGLCHISELSEEYVSSVADVCRVGDVMRVKVIAVDDQDRVKLSRKAAMRELAENGK